MESKETKKSFVKKLADFAKSIDRTQLVLIGIGTVAILGVLIYSIAANIKAPNNVSTDTTGSGSSETESLAPVVAEGSSEDIIVKEDKDDTLACYGIYDDDGIAVMLPDGTQVTDDIYYTMSDYVGEDDLVAVGDSTPMVSYINYKTGKTAITTEYAAGSPFVNGFAAVSRLNPVNSKYYIYGYINKSGELIRKFDLITAKTPTAEGLALASPSSTELYGYIDNTGEFAISANFTNAGSFKNGIAPAAKDSKWGFINTKGEFIINPAFDEVGWFSEGYAKVKVGDKWGFIDKNGKYIAEPQFSACEDFQNGAAAVKYGDLYGYINTKGQFIIEPQFEEAYSFFCGLASVKTGGKFGFIDVTGKVVIEAKYDSTFDFYEGIARVKEGSSYYYLDVNGNPICDKKFASATDFVSGQAIVEANGYYGVIDKSGNYVIEPKYKSIKVVRFMSADAQ